MHQTRAVGRDDIFGAGPRMVADLVVPHLRRDGLLEDREGAAKSAALIRPRRGDELDPFDLESRSIGLEKKGSCSSEGLACFRRRNEMHLLWSPTRCGNLAHGNASTCMGLFLSSSHFWLFGDSLFGAGMPFFVPSPAIRFAERAEGVKGPKRLAALVFRSAPCSSQGQALRPEHAEG